jgi:hypothetical protein
MTFNIYTTKGIHYMQYFQTIDELITHMVKNNQHSYHRIN